MNTDQYSEEKYDEMSYADSIRYKSLHTGSHIGEIHKKLIISENKLSQEQLFYSEALYKMFDEIFSNAYDQYIQTNYVQKKRKTTKIEVVLKSDGTISVYNDGHGFNLDGNYNIEDLFLKEFAGSNHHRSKDIESGKKFTIGRNGVGLGAVVYQSSELIFETYNGTFQKMYTQKFINGIPEKPIIIKRESIDYSKFTFMPDYKIACNNYDNFNELLYTLSKLMYTRCVLSKICDDNVVIKFNGCDIKLTIPDILKYNITDQDQFVFQNIGIKNEKLVWKLGFGKNCCSVYKIISMVNGVDIPNGGHIKQIKKYIKEYIISRVKKEYKLELENVNIFKKNVLIISAFIESPEYSSQLKDKVTLLKSDFESLDTKQLDSFCDSIYLLAIDEIIAATGKQNTLDDEIKKLLLKYEPCKDKNAPQKIIAVTEGDSAQTTFKRGVCGLPNVGIFPLKGVPVNACKNSSKKIINESNTKIIPNDKLKENAVYNAIIYIVGLKYNEVYTKESLKKVKISNACTSY